jgi:hypothetical protein
MSINIPSNFKKRLSIFIAPIIVLSLIFTLLVHFSGPRIRTISIDNSFTNQQLIMSFNADIANIENVEINPIIDFEYTHNNYQMFVSFSTPLRFDTLYSIDMTLTDTRGVSSRQKVIFQTNNPEIYFLNRNESLNDIIYKTTLDSDINEIVYESDSIILYDFTHKSFVIVEEIDKQQYVLIKSGGNTKPVQLPVDYNIDAISASSTQDLYIFTLTEEISFEKTLWEYSAESGSFRQLLDDQSRPLEGSNAVYAPDGKSIFYLDKNRSLFLISSDSSQPPINIGVFDTVNRILPNEKGVFGYTNNKYLTVISNDGSELEAPEDVQNSSLTQQFNSLDDYVYIQQELDNNRLYLQQNLISYINDKIKVISSTNVKDRLMLNSYLSPNDEFVLTEEALQPVIYDGVYPNGKPKNGFTNIIDVNSGAVVKTLEGYDVKWKLQ